MPVVITSMPIARDLKRYFWSKYCWLRTNNGAKFAAATFKELRQVVMSYIDDLDRTSRIEEYVARCPVRKNGWLRKLFVYADTQPLVVLQFLKLYTVEDEPVVSADEAAEEMDAELERAQPVGIPSNLYAWMWTLSHRAEFKECLRMTWRGQSWEPSHHELAWCGVAATAIVNGVKSAGGTYRDAIRKGMGYVDKMLRILTPRAVSDKEALYLTCRGLPIMESYKKWSDPQRGVPPTDYDIHGIPINSESNPMEEDLMSLLSLSESWGPEVAHILEVLPNSLLEEANFINEPEEGMEVVGHIRQIPKKGTVVRRSIADPNKYLQAGLEPFRRFLRSISNKIPRNCQFNQEKLDEVIRTELNYGFAGSVDLHKATDWLPLDWFNALEEILEETWYPTQVAAALFDGKQCFENSVLRASRNLFYRMSRACWDNEGFTSRWQRGQPLGTTPSFEILTITHFCVLEALCWCRGRLDSPYALLGDDVVIFDEGIRSDYIATMQSVDSPLSLHKSYDGRLTEFAGKVHVVNQRARYCSDIPMVSWTNLFDYQRSTGIAISYRDLPKEVKVRLEKYASTYQPGLRPEDLYRAMQLCADVPTSTHMTEVIGQLVKNFYSSTKDEEATPIRSHYGFVFLGRSGLYDHPVIPPTNRKRKPAKWWKKKNRPETTTAIARKCCLAH
jgi:hypothetical protein